MIAVSRPLEVKTQQLAEPCRRGHVGFRRLLWRYNKKRKKDYLMLVCDDCSREDNNRRDKARRDAGLPYRPSRTNKVRRD